METILGENYGGNGCAFCKVITPKYGYLARTVIIHQKITKAAWICDTCRSTNKRNKDGRFTLKEVK